MLVGVVGLAVLALASTLHAARGQLHCGDATSTSLRVWWDPVVVASADAVYVSLHASPTAPLFALELAPAHAHALDLRGLVPDRVYFLRLRAHNASAPSIVWHWFNVTEAPVACATRAVRDGAPHSLTARSVTSAQVGVGWAMQGPAGQGSVVRLLDEHNTTIATVRTNDTQTTFTGLAAAREYHVVVQALSSGTTSDPLWITTQPPNSQSTSMYRVSEYTNDVDFLENHNSASLEGQAAFLTNTADNDFFSSLSPISLYCVDHMDPLRLGWAPYISCNGPEADPRNNPEDPLCICDVFADRMIALQNATEMQRACNPIVWDGDTHNDPICNCSRDGQWSKWVVPEESELRPGLMPTFLPYFYYQVPQDTYPEARRFGENYSTPKRSVCERSQPLGHEGCTWKYRSTVTVLHHAQLLAFGWNATVVEHWPLHEHGPNTTDMTLQNTQAFRKAWDSLQDWIRPQCCGC